MFAQTAAATQFGEREGNRFPSLLRLVSLLNHNLPSFAITPLPKQTKLSNILDIPPSIVYNENVKYN